MKTLKKAFAAVSSFVLAFALMVPAVAWADDEELALRLNYNGEPVVLSELSTVPHSVSITFHTHVDYPGYANVQKDTTFTLSDSSEIKQLRIAQATEDSEGNITVLLSNGDQALPMTDGHYLDIGTLNVKVDGTLDYDSEDAAEMKAGVIAITELNTSDSDYQLARNTGTEANPVAEVPFTLADSSFAKVVGTPQTDGDDEDDGKKPVVKDPIVNTPDDVTGPTTDEVKDAVTPVAVPALQAIWNGQDAKGVSAEDQARIKEFMDAAKAAGYDLEDLAVEYRVEVLRYEDVADVPEEDKELLDSEFGGYDELGYYELNVLMVVSVPADATLGDVSAYVTYVDTPLPFTVEVASGALYGKVPVVGYAHDGEAKSIDEGVTGNEEASTVSFSAWEFSTYGVYAAEKVTAPTPSGPYSGGGLATTGDDVRMPIMLGIGALVLCAALAIAFTRKPKHQ